MSEDRNEILNAPPRNNNTFLHAPLNKKPVVEVSANMRMPLFPYDEGYRFLPENMDSYELAIYKKIKGKYYISAVKSEKGELNPDIFDPYDFTKAEIGELFGKGSYRVVLTGIMSGQDEKVDVWQRNIKINDGLEMQFFCPDGVFMENELMTWEKYYKMKKEEEEPEEEEQKDNKPLGGIFGKFGLGKGEEKVEEEEEEEEEPKPRFGMGGGLGIGARPSFMNRDNQEPEEEEEEEPDNRDFDRNRDIGTGRERERDFDRFRDRDRDFGRERDRDRDFDRDRGFRRDDPDSRYSRPPVSEEDEIPAWAKKLVEKKEEEKSKPLIAPELVTLAGTALTAILTNMQEASRRRDEEERRRYEILQEERRREYEMRRAEEERKREEDKRKWEEERKREEQRRQDEEKRRDEERRAEDKRREEDRRRYEEMRREEDKRADMLREEIRLERERIQREKDLVERERIKTLNGGNAQTLNPQIVEIMKTVDKLQEERLQKINNSGDLKTNLIQTVNQFKEVKEMLVDLGLAQPPEASSGGIEGFLGRVMQNMDPEKAAILTQAVFEKVGPMLGFGGQAAPELPPEVDVS